MELEKLDENFLRRNNFMPVNLYKGENYNTEQKIGLRRKFVQQMVYGAKHLILTRRKK